LYINSIIYTEVSIGFNKIKEVEQAIFELGIKVIEIPREALFLAGKVFLKYKMKISEQSNPADTKSRTADLSVFSFGNLKLTH
jgi:hypothetical protein